MLASPIGHKIERDCPLRALAIARRRHLAASGPMPPALAARFTVSELAVLKIVSDEIRQHGTCFCTVAEIAARAGTSRTKVQDAIRQAARLGLLTVQERRREGQKNPPNVSGLPRMAAVASYRVQKNRPHGQRRRGF